MKRLHAVIIIMPQAKLKISLNVYAKCKPRYGAGYVSVKRTYTLQTAVQHLFHAGRRSRSLHDCSFGHAWLHPWVVNTLSHCRQCGGHRQYECQRGMNCSYYMVKTTNVLNRIKSDKRPCTYKFAERTCIHADCSKIERCMKTAGVDYRHLQGGPKNWHHFCTPELYQILTRFQNYFTVRIRRKFVVLESLKIPPHLKGVATLLCEMSVS